MLVSAFKNSQLALSAGSSLACKVSELDGKGRLAPTHARLRAFWGQQNFWVQSVEPSGLPIFVFRDGVGVRCLLEAVVEKFAEVCEMRIVANYTPELVGSSAFRAVHFVLVDCVDCWYEESFSLPDLMRALDGTESATADSLYMRCFGTYMWDEFGQTEQEFAYLGAYPWGPLEALICDSKVLPVVKPIPDQEWAIFERAMRRGRRNDRKVAWGMLKSWVVVTLDMKHRHYTTLIELMHQMALTWSLERRHTDAYWGVSLFLLRGMLQRDIGYERILLFIGTVFSHRYWPTQADFYVQTGVHLYDLESNIKVHKEITVTVNKTWMIPLSNTPHICSAYWHNMDANVGYAHTLPNADAEDAIIRILQQLTTKLEYSFVDDKTGERSAKAYVDQFRNAAVNLMEPLYRDSARKGMSWDSFLEARILSSGGGAAGRFTSSFLPEHVPGPQKKYAMGRLSKEQVDLFTWESVTTFSVGSKMDERGPTRPIVAIDTFRALLAAYAFHLINNKFPDIGWDIGESPTEELGRYVGLTAMSHTSQGFIGNERPAIAAYDFQQWDHWVQYSEQRIIKETMLELGDKYIVDQEVRKDVHAALVKMIETHDQAVYTSVVFAEEHLRHKIDKMLRDANAESFHDHVGIKVLPGQRIQEIGGQGDAFLVRASATQQSGRWETLVGNTQISRTRLALRDAEMKRIGGEMMAAVLSFNRADDVLELYKNLFAAVTSVRTMLAIGYKANAKKQVVSRRAGVYFRIIYANGTMRGMPARTVYSILMGPPAKVAGSLPINLAIISSLAINCERAVRRGLEPSLMVRIYVEGSSYFSRITVMLKPAGMDPIEFSFDERREYRLIGVAITRDKVTFRIKRHVLEAAPHLGGFGILRPGEVFYNEQVQVSPPVFRKQLEILGRALARREREEVDLPGVEDLASRAEGYMKETLGYQAPAPSVERFRRDVRLGVLCSKGSGELNLAKRRITLLSAMRVSRPRRGYDATGGINRGAGDAVNAVARIYAGAVSQRADNKLNWGWLRAQMACFRAPPGYGCLKRLWFGLGQYVATELKGQALSDFVHLVLNYAVTTRALARVVTRKLSDKDILRYLLGEFEPMSALSQSLPAGLQQLSKSVFQTEFLRALEQDGSRICGFEKWFAHLERDIVSTILRQTFDNLPHLMLN